MNGVALPEAYADAGGSPSGVQYANRAADYPHPYACVSAGRVRQFRDAVLRH
jgi:hypothetical protein